RALAIQQANKCRVSTGKANVNSIDTPVFAALECAPSLLPSLGPNFSNIIGINHHVACPSSHIFGRRRSTIENRFRRHSPWVHICPLDRSFARPSVRLCRRPCLPCLPSPPLPPIPASRFLRLPS